MPYGCPRTGLCWTGTKLTDPAHTVTVVAAQKAHRAGGERVAYVATERAAFWWRGAVFARLRLRRFLAHPAGEAGVVSPAIAVLRRPPAPDEVARPHFGVGGADACGPGPGDGPRMDCTGNPACGARIVIM